MRSKTQLFWPNCELVGLHMGTPPAYGYALPWPAPGHKDHLGAHPTNILIAQNDRKTHAFHNVRSQTRGKHKVFSYLGQASGLLNSMNQNKLVKSLRRVSFFPLPSYAWRHLLEANLSNAEKHNTFSSLFSKNKENSMVFTTFRELAGGPDVLT